MSLQTLYAEILQEIDNNISNYNHYCDELKSLKYKIGLQEKQAKIHDTLIAILQDLCVVDKIVRERYPYMDNAMDFILKLNKTRRDGMVNFIHQKLNIANPDEDE